MRNGFAFNVQEFLIAVAEGREDLQSVPAAERPFKAAGLWRPRRNRFRFRKFRTCRRLKRDVSVESIRAHRSNAPTGIERLQHAVNWLLGPEPINGKRPGHLWPRWIFLRALGLIYFSAFYSLVFQIKGLIGPNGLLPAGLSAGGHVRSFRSAAILVCPTLLWIGSEQSHADGDLLDRADRFGASGFQCVAAGNALRLFRLLFSFVAPRRIFPATNRTGCCSKRDLSRCFSRRRDSGRDWGEAIRLRARVCSCCNGNGSAFISNRAWRRFEAAILRGAISRRWTITIRTARYRRGLDGTCSIYRTGFTRGRLYSRSRLSLCWCGCFFLPRRFPDYLLLYRDAIRNRNHPDRELHVS